MTMFTPTHKLMAPAGEEIPVMLISQPEQMDYLVITEVEYESGTDAFYQWHPYRGVMYNGTKLDGLNIFPLEYSQNQWRLTYNKSDGYKNQNKNQNFAHQLMVL